MEKTPTQSLQAGDSRRRARKPIPGSALRWSFAIVFTLVVHAGAFFFITIPEASPWTSRHHEPVVAWLGERALTSSSTVGEQLALFDQAPLFFPTRWNYSADEVDLFSGGTSPADSFGYYEEKLVVESGRGPSGLHAPITTVQNAREALATFAWPTLAGFGRVDRPKVVVPARLATIQVRNRIGADPLFSANVVAGPQPDWPDWQPFEMLVLVGDVGVVGEPLVVPRGAGSAAVEEFFRNYVRTQLRLDLRVPPGHYRVFVGP